MRLSRTWFLGPSRHILQASAYASQILAAFPKLASSRGEGRHAAALSDGHMQLVQPSALPSAGWPLFLWQWACLPVHIILLHHHFRGRLDMFARVGPGITFAGGVNAPLDPPLIRVVGVLSPWPLMATRRTSSGAPARNSHMFSLMARRPRLSCSPSGLPSIVGPLELIGAGRQL